MSNLYTSGVINIPSVTGNIVITATATVAVVSSISAVYTQSGTVYDTDSLNDLKDDLVVTATYEGGSTGVVASTDYTLSGTLTAGTSTITVSYGGKTATFSVTVTRLYDWDDGVAYSTSVYSPLENNYFYTNADGTKQAYTGWSCTNFVNCYGASTIYMDKLSGYVSLPDGRYSWFFDSERNPVSGAKFNDLIVSEDTTATHYTIRVPVGAYYFSLSEDDAQINRFLDGSYTITPNA